MRIQLKPLVNQVVYVEGFFERMEDRPIGTSMLFESVKVYLYGYWENPIHLDHLWIYFEGVSKDDLPREDRADRLSLFTLIATVIEYQRKDGSIDYSVELDESKSIDWIPRFHPMNVGGQRIKGRKGLKQALKYIQSDRERLLNNSLIISKEYNKDFYLDFLNLAKEKVEKRLETYKPRKSNLRLIKDLKN